MRASVLTPLLCSLIALCGCAGYKLGPTNGQAAGARSIHVAPLLNQTLEPRLTDSITAALRKSFQLDGTFRLGSAGEADIVVTGNVTEYRRRAQSLAPSDLATGRDYRLEITVQITATERATGRVLLEKSIPGSTLIRVGSDLSSSERQAMPLLGEDVAKQIVSLLAEGTW